LALGYFSYCRQSNLDRDPASISEIMSIVRRSNDRKERSEDNGALIVAVFGRDLDQSKFYLETDQDGGPFIRRSRTDSDLNKDLALPTTPAGGTDSARSTQYSPIRPLELRLMTASLLVGFLLATLTGITFIQVASSRHNGVFTDH